MIILAGTDFHGDAEAFRRFASKAEDVRAEMLILCGDITHFGTIQEARSLLAMLTGLRVPVIFVPGNCDPPSLAELEVDGACSLHGRYTSYDEVAFLGVGGSSVTPFGTPFELTEEEIHDLLGRAFTGHQSKRWLILVSHSPPLNTEVDRLPSGRHVGSGSVRRFIEETKPSAVLCGHVHEARGIDMLGGSILVNPGPAKHGDCAVVAVEDDLDVKLEHF